MLRLGDFGIDPKPPLAAGRPTHEGPGSCRSRRAPPSPDPAPQPGGRLAEFPSTAAAGRWGPSATSSKSQGLILVDSMDDRYPGVYSNLESGATS